MKSHLRNYDYLQGNPFEHFSNCCLIQKRGFVHIHVNGQEILLILFKILNQTVDFGVIFT